jgi:2-methylcitrate dehydratase PrpD
LAPQAPQNFSSAWIPTCALRTYSHGKKKRGRRLSVADETQSLLGAAWAAQRAKTNDLPNGGKCGYA